MTLPDFLRDPTSSIDCFRLLLVYYYYYFFKFIYTPGSKDPRAPGLKTKNAKSKCRMVIGPAGQLAVSCKSTELKRYYCYYYYYYAVVNAPCVGHNDDANRRRKNVGLLVRAILWHPAH